MSNPFFGVLRFQIFKNKYDLPRKVSGGGLKPRLSYFTVDNLHHILRNKVYIGVKEYTENGVRKEATALWEPIIDRTTFSKAQKLLTENKSAKKPFTDIRYPYILTGLVFCAQCSEAMVGKSAHAVARKSATMNIAGPPNAKVVFRRSFFAVSQHV